jgi:hypothetical protein
MTLKSAISLLFRHEAIIHEMKSSPSTPKFIYYLSESGVAVRLTVYYRDDGRIDYLNQHMSLIDASAEIARLFDNMDYNFEQFREIKDAEFEVVLDWITKYSDTSWPLLMLNKWGASPYFG